MSPIEIAAIIGAYIMFGGVIAGIAGTDHVSTTLFVVLLWPLALAVFVGACIKENI